MKVALPYHGEFTTTRTLFEFFTWNKEEENGLCGLGLALYQLGSQLKPLLLYLQHTFAFYDKCVMPRGLKKELG